MIGFDLRITFVTSRGNDETEFDVGEHVTTFSKPSAIKEFVRLIRAAQDENRPKWIAYDREGVNYIGLVDLCSHGTGIIVHEAVDSADYGKRARTKEMLLACSGDLYTKYKIEKYAHAIP